VAFEHAAPERFDLVIGAGGLHSPVRKLVFGPEGRFEKYLGYYAASFSIDGYPRKDPRAYVSYAAPGRQASRYSLRGDRAVFLFVFSRETNLLVGQRDLKAQKEILREVFREDGWECQDILKAMETCSDLYFDSVSQSGELKKAGGDYHIAYRNYEQLFHPLIMRKQRAAERFSGSFAPKTKFGIFVRNQVIRLMSLPFVANLAMGRLLSDPLTLPVYDSR
jgi:2-polyprenyl-6-methoxyphenol hydroxylase-like FAD-dependent oxidoreductase